MGIEQDPENTQSSYPSQPQNNDEISLPSTTDLVLSGQQSIPEQHPGLPEEEPLDEKAQQAITHFEQYIRNRHPELTAEELRVRVDTIIKVREIRDYLIESDTLDEQMLQTHPDWVRWYERKP